MVRLSGGSPRQLQGVLAAFMVAGCSLASVAFAAGHVTWSALLLVIAFGPLALYLAARAPLLFPFGLYVLLIPFDDLTRIGSFGSLTKALGLLSAAAIALRLITRREALTPPRAVLAWCALLTWMALSPVWALNPSDAINALVHYMSLIALYVLLSIVPVRPSELRLTLGIALLSGAVAGLYTLWMLHSGQTYMDTSQRVVIASSTASIDPNELGASFLFPTALALWLTTAVRAPALRLLGAVTSLVLTMAIAATASRGAIIGLAALFLYFIVRSRHRIAIAIGLAVSVLAGLMLNPGILQRFQIAGKTGAAGRTDIWAIGLHYVPAHWLLGAGVGNFQDAFQHEYLGVLVHYTFESWTRPAHNVFVQIIVELGVFGFALFVLGFFLQWRSLRSITSFHPDFELRLALEAGFVGLLVASSSLDMIDLKYFWFVLATMSMLRTSAMYHAVESADHQRTPVARNVSAHLQPITYGRKS